MRRIRLIHYLWYLLLTGTIFISSGCLVQPALPAADHVSAVPATPSPVALNAAVVASEQATDAVVVSSYAAPDGASEETVAGLMAAPASTTLPFSSTSSPVRPAQLCATLPTAPLNMHL
ncbi:MAG: hypothetical protein R3E79_45285 [Caldilineaceae bacterium]